MKFSFITKTAIFIVATTITLQTPLISHNSNFIFQKFDFVSDSINSINKIKKQENPYKITREYKIADKNNNKIMVKTKVRYSDYRKKPKVYANYFKVDTSHINAKSISFIYNSKKDKNHITQINKGSKENTKIALNSNVKFTKSA